MFGIFDRGNAALITQLAETNRIITLANADLHNLGLAIGAELDAATKRAGSVRRSRLGGGLHRRRYGNPAGRTREEMSAILGRFGHTLPA